MTYVKGLFNENSKSETWQIGDQAMMGIEENLLVRGALLAYVVPLVLLVLGAVLADGLGLSEFAVVCSSILGLSIGGVLIWLHAKRSRKNSCYYPVILSKVILAI